MRLTFSNKQQPKRVFHWELESPTTNSQVVNALIHLRRWLEATPMNDTFSISVQFPLFSISPTGLPLLPKNSVETTKKRRLNKKAVEDVENPI